MDKGYVYQFLEPCGGVMSNRPHQLQGSVDNGILFSVIAYHMFPFLGGQWIAKILCDRHIASGMFSRHPQESFPSLQDDHIAVCCMGPLWAKEVYEYGCLHGWLFSDVTGWRNNLRAYGIKGTFTRWIGRFGSLRFGSRIIATGEASLLPSIGLGVCYMLDALSDRRATSGTQLLLILRWAIVRFGVSVPVWNPLHWAFQFWRWRCGVKFADGEAGMFKVYYSPSLEEHGMLHPFALYGARHWS